MIPPAAAATPTPSSAPPTPSGGRLGRGRRRRRRRLARGQELLEVSHLVDDLGLGVLAGAAQVRLEGFDGLLGAAGYLLVGVADVEKYLVFRAIEVVRVEPGLN